ncbi:hypothetical protein POV27_12590 [Aureisphaera galaxeae]|uniref:hypothetical protein n=1 Tax=Aureisphaera galaxeae TaxID=1538023 RepID=UPI0023501858|nr:hypothetical protein [Aureisphaera galaxeae]MDC8004892.1 hypothetical protein [Aureisphaera galaxeae]
MKLFQLLLLAIVFTIVSCNPVDKKHLQGTWDISTYQDDPIFWLFEIQDDTIMFLDDAGFEEKVPFKINPGSIQLKSSDGTLDTMLPFKYFNRDSIKIGKNTFKKSNKEIDEYSIQLLDIASPKKGRFDIQGIPVGVFKRDGQPVMTLGPMEVSILDILMTLHDRNRTTTPSLFLDRSVDLSVLKHLQMEFSIARHNRMYLVLQKEGFHTYHTVFFRPFCFHEDLVRYNEQHSYPPPLPSDGFLSKETFQKNGGLIIDIDSNTPVMVLNVIHKNQNCVVRISEEVSVEKYIEILLKLEKFGENGVSIPYYID